MKTTRMLGNYVQNLAMAKGLSTSELSDAIGYTDTQMLAFYKGRLLLTYEQLTVLSHKLNVSIQEILVGDENGYNKTVVHNMNDFIDANNRELILDIIETYVDIDDLVKSISQ